MAEAEYKICPKCGENKPLSEFHTQRSAPDGKTRKCGICRALPPDDINIEEFVRLTHEETNGQLAERYKHSVYTINQWKVSLRKLGYDCGTIKTWGGRTFHKKVTVNETEPEFPEVESAGFPESYEEDFTKYEVLKRDRLIVFGDLHIPYHDVRVLDMAYQVAKRYGIKTGLINGDFVDNDLFSNFPKVHPNRHEYIVDELNPSSEILKLFMKQLDELVWLEANHERWLNRRVGGHFSVFNLMESILGVRYSQYSYAYVESGDEEILVCHPKNYRKKPGSLPLELCTRYLKNVLCGHVHRLCFQYHSSGRFWAAEGGHCCDAKKLNYKNRDVDLHGTWNPGFVMILDGWPHLIEPRTWGAYMQPHHDIEKERKKPPEIPKEILQMRAALAEWEANHAD